MPSDRRSDMILQLMVDAYIQNAQPISSATLLRLNPRLCLSPATVRAIMADLESRGYLKQPHTSSGRIPTERGLRHYLTGLHPPKVRPKDRTRLQAATLDGDAATFPAALGHALSGLIGQMVVVATPRFLGSHLREIGLVRCGPRQVLAYFVSPTKLVQQKLLELEHDISAAELVCIQNYLNTHLANRTLPEVRRLIVAELEDAQACHDHLRSQALRLGARLLPCQQSAQWDVCVEGTSHLAEHPEFGDLRQLRVLLRTIEEKEGLLRLLDRILDNTGVVVMLGSEHRLRGAPDLACVGCAWEGDTGRKTAISVMGPSRMDYGRLVPLVEYATQLFGQFWEQI